MTGEEAIEAIENLMMYRGESIEEGKLRDILNRYAIEKAKGLESTLSDVAFVLKNFGGSVEVTEGEELLLNSPDTEYDLVGVIDGALAKWEKEK